MKALLIIATLFGWAVPAAAADYGPTTAYAMVRALDKVSARTELLAVPVGQTVAFRALRIKVDACHEKAGEGDAVAFLEVVEVEAERPDQSVFTGWMFAPAPAVSAMEHGVYNVWLVGCSDEPPKPGKDG